MSNIFKDIFKGKVVIVGIGNVLRGDDAFGPKLIENLKGEIQAVCIDAGSTPENYLGKIAKERPNTILFVDAVDLGKAAGEYEILTKKDILNSGFSTHDLSVRMFIDFLEREVDANIYLLGVQPGDVSFGSQMSERVRTILEEISWLIKKSLGNQLICMKRI